MKNKNIIIMLVSFLIIGISIYGGYKVVLYVQNKMNNEIDCQKLGNQVKEMGEKFNGEGSYEIKNGKVYVKDYIGSTLNYDLVPTDIDADSFRVISSGYSRDDTYIYYWGKRIQNAGYCSFEVSVLWSDFEMSEGFARDTNNVFNMGKIMDKTDVSTFKRMGPFYFKDKNYVYDRDGNIIKGLDVNTFGYNDKKYHAYDKNGVYDDDIHIIGADGESFEKLGGGYVYKDKNHVYFRSKIVEGADTNTFEEISYEYFKDKNHVYDAGGNIIGQIDATSYGHKDLNGILYDKNGVQASGIYFSGADGESFVDLGYGYFKDKNKVYYKTRYHDGGYKNIEKNINNVNVEKFTVFKEGAGYATDGNKLFFQGSLVTEGIDISKCTRWYDCDKNYPYNGK